MPKLKRGPISTPITLGILLIIGAIYFFYSPENVPLPIRNIDSTTREVSQSSQNNISWTFDGKSWQVNGNPPNCESPLKFPPPVDLSLVSGILYPGQMRGNDYKPHGGFRFDNQDTNEIELRAIMDGYLLKASRYEVDGEIQILMFYVNDCGVMVMHDHLLVASPKLKKIFDQIPVGKNGDSRTTEIKPRVYLEKGELLATQLGFKENKNIFTDFGLYDLRKTNGVQYSYSFRAKNPNINEYGTHALCWFENLFPADENIVKNLPAGGHEGKVSDYCE